MYAGIWDLVGIVESIEKFQMGDLVRMLEVYVAVRTDRQGN